MDYKDYSIEQIMDDCYNYQTICNLFMELVRDADKSKLEEILYQGKYNNFKFNTKLSNVNNPFREAQRRIDMAYLFIKNPETFDILVNERVNLFHGTSAKALPSILKYGVTSGLKSENLGIEVSSGEVWSRIGGKQRNFVSFTDVLDVAYYYSAIGIENEDLSFEVMIGTTIDDAMKNGITRVFSDTPEVAIKNKLALDSIRVIGVPSERVEFVKKLIPNDSIKVVAIDSVINKFYYIDENSNSVDINYDEFNRVKESVSKPKKNVFFKLEDIRKMMIERILLRVKSFKNKKDINEVEVINGKSR